MTRFYSNGATSRTLHTPLPSQSVFRKHHRQLCHSSADASDPLYVETHKRERHFSAAAAATTSPPLRAALCRRDLSVKAAASVEADDVIQEDVAVDPVSNKKLRIKLKSFTLEPMKTAVQMIIDAAIASGARVAGPVPLPTRRSLYCVLTSPHVNKDAREHFEIRTHSRLIDIHNLTAATIDQLMILDIPAGVDANIKII